VSIRFWLSRPRTVVFYVDQLAPTCRYIGKFLVRGRKGQNVFRFRARVRGRALEPGTYRLTARPRHSARARLAGVTIVVFTQRPGKHEVAAAHGENTCPGEIPPSVRAAQVGAAAGGDDRGQAIGVDSSDDGSGGVAGALATSRRPDGNSQSGPVATAAEKVRAVAQAVPPAVFALALLAALLLAVAAMPQPVRTSRAGATLVHHRATVALMGIGVLIGALLSFALSQ